MTAIRGGYWGKIAWVDLTKEKVVVMKTAGEIEEEPEPEQLPPHEEEAPIEEEPPPKKEEPTPPKKEPKPEPVEEAAEAKKEDAKTDQIEILKITFIQARIRP